MEMKEVAQMCMTMTVHEAQADFSRLLVRVRRGEEVIIAQDGQPVARVVPVKSPMRRRPGSAAGQVIIHPDFDAPLPADVLDAFEQ
jgi:prevent-host-death family protein